MKLPLKVYLIQHLPWSLVELFYRQTNKSFFYQVYCTMYKYLARLKIFALMFKVRKVCMLFFFFFGQCCDLSTSIVTLLDTAVFVREKICC